MTLRCNATKIQIPHPATSGGSSLVPATQQVVSADAPANYSFTFFILLVGNSQDALEAVSAIMLLDSGHRKRTGSLILRPERNKVEFDHLFALRNCNTSGAEIGPLLISFECSMTVESSYFDCMCFSI